MRGKCLTIALRSVITIDWRPVWKKSLKSEDMRDIYKPYGKPFLAPVVAISSYWLMS